MGHRRSYCHTTYADYIWMLYRRADYISNTLETWLCSACKHYGFFIAETVMFFLFNGVATRSTQIKNINHGVVLARRIYDFGAAQTTGRKLYNSSR